MSQIKKILITNVASLVVLVGGGIAGYHFYDEATNYIKTDNAKVDGQQIVISAPISGKLTSWNVTNGEQFDKNATIGEISIPSPTQQNPNNMAQVDVKAPTPLTIVNTDGLENSMVAAGMPLAYSYDMEHLYVTSNIKETELKNVEVGQEVDIYIDAFKDTKFTGKVQEIGLTTAGTFSLLPEGNANANYTKVTQVVPVKISIDDMKGNKLLPGMNVTVRIHK